MSLTHAIKLKALGHHHS